MSGVSMPAISIPRRTCPITGLARGPDRFHKCLPSKAAVSACSSGLVSGGGAAADVFVEDARDQALIRKSFLCSAPFEHLKVGAREADVNARILPQVTPGCPDCSLLRRLLVLHGPEFAALICGDQLPFLVIMKSALFHADSRFHADRLHPQGDPGGICRGGTPAVRPALRSRA